MDEEERNVDADGLAAERPGEELGRLSLSKAVSSGGVPRERFFGADMDAWVRGGGRGGGEGGEGAKVVRRQRTSRERNAVAAAADAPSGWRRAAHRRGCACGHGRRVGHQRPSRRPEKPPGAGALAQGGRRRCLTRAKTARQARGRLVRPAQAVTMLARRLAREKTKLLLLLLLQKMSPPPPPVRALGRTGAGLGAALPAAGCAVGRAIQRQAGRPRLAAAAGGCPRCCSGWGLLYRSPGRLPPEQAPPAVRAAMVVWLLGDCCRWRQPWAWRPCRRRPAWLPGNTRRPWRQQRLRHRRRRRQRLRGGC